MRAPNETPSQHSIARATRSRASFSGHGGSLGAAGYRDKAHNPANCDFLEEPGQSIAISPGAEGFSSLMIGVSWNQIIQVEEAGFLEKLLGKTPKRKIDIDLDLGCLYELQNGERGAIQAFGKKFGHYEKAPFIRLSGDERSGQADGHDEFIMINGHKWDEIKRILVYIYIYDGAPRWSDITPQIILDVPGENDLVVTLKAHNDALALCAIGGLENIRGGVKLTNYTEYFPGHEEMDRAFGFGLDWEDGKKST